MEGFDFSGWATRNNIRCADGRTITKDAFADMDGKKVPMVWNHQHNDPLQVLGHAILKNCEDGVYAYCYLNDTEAGENARKFIKHGDVESLSIYANNLKHQGSNVVHGIIRELSLVLAGANPGAFIDSVMCHSESSEDEAEIYFGEPLELAHSDDNNKEEEKEEVANKEKTVQDVLDSMNEEQLTVTKALVGAALQKSENDKKETDIEEEEDDMKHNIFDQNGNQEDALMHSAMQTIIADGKRCGSLRESFLQHADEYGITHIDYLFPDAQLLDKQPGFIKRTPDNWVGTVMNGVHHSPFARIKMVFADITNDEARAKGYAQKGKLKKEEVFSLLKRVVEPTTVYKKQKLDRDDIIDITDMDVVAWLKGEMRMMLDEELARAIVFGDGRSSMSDDKISETNIIPIVSDQSLYTIKKTVKAETSETFEHAFVRSCVESQDDYEGSGNTTLFVANTTVTKLLLMEDADGRRMYKDLADLALALNVNKISKVPASIIPSDSYGVIVDLADYNVGADKGGSVNMFDDFDIDYNQQKYLIETRCSGALTKPYSAIALKKDLEAAG